MSNASIIQRMKDACDQWEAGAIDSNELAGSLAWSANALDGVKRSIVEQACEWSLKIEIASDYGNFEGNERAVKEIRIVLNQIREWIDGLSV